MKTLLILVALAAAWYVFYGQPAQLPSGRTPIGESAQTAVILRQFPTPSPDGRGKVASRTRDGCDPSYPDEDTCIPLGPPFDQGCEITNERFFTVLPPDPQHLDADKDGIGCEPIGANPAPRAPAPAMPPAAPPANGECDPSYPDVCIPPVWVYGDLDCRDVPYARFRVIGVDPHRLDGPYDGSNPYEPDGIGCEWN